MGKQIPHKNLSIGSTPIGGIYTKVTEVSNKL